jgi:cellulose synthase/poly-beta-1,6-N-acetylglucosamine synthase-like glycosyltransferase
MLELVFWGALFLVFYAYLGYPLTLALAARLRRRLVQKTAFFPAVTLIITAYNEEKRIREKVENTLALDYPREKLQVLVASDGSTDTTAFIVREYAERGIKLLQVGERRGKENAQREAVAIASGEILVFTDVATRLDPDGLAQIVANFADPTVGCVSSEDHVQGQDGTPAGEGMYVRYEMWLRRLESSVYSLVGLSGSFFAARKRVCQDFSAEMQSDFRTLLNSIKLGLRGVCDPNAVGYYLDVSDPRKEMERKVRTVIRGMTVFFRHLELLNYFRYGIFSFQFFCHKLVRWLVPFFMAAALAANVSLALTSSAYQALLAMQLVFYAAALIIFTAGLTTHTFILKLPAYFFTVNLAIAIAWWRYIKGDRVVMWTPSQR